MDHNSPAWWVESTQTGHCVITAAGAGEAVQAPSEGGGGEESELPIKKQTFNTADNRQTRVHVTTGH